MLIAVDSMDSGTRICMVHESARLCELGRTATDCAKTYEPIVSRFGRQTRVGPKRRTVCGWHHLANTIECFLCGNDAASCLR